MLKSSHKSKGINITLSATLTNIDRAAEKTERFLSTSNMEELIFDIILVLREALTNAVIHGSEKNPQKDVTYSLQAENGFLLMEVEDKGDGFDWRSYLDRDLPSEQGCGRGLAIMKRYSTSIEYNEKGNRVTLFRKKQPVEPFGKWLSR